MTIGDYEFILSYAEKWQHIFSNMIGFGGGLFDKNLNLLRRVHHKDILMNIVGSNHEKNQVLDAALERKFTTTEMTTINLQSIDGCREIRSLEVINIFDTNPQVFMVFRHPIINPDTGDVAGLWIFGYPIEASNISGLVSDFYVQDSTCRKNLKQKKIHLTKREQQVVFFFMLNLKSVQIATFITKIERKNITKDSVDQLFRRQLFPKFNVVNRSALYDKLHEMGFDQVIPYSVLDDGFSIEITNNQIFI